MFAAERVKRNFFHGYAPLLLQHFLRVRGPGFQLTSALEDLLAVKPSQEAWGGGELPYSLGGGLPLGL